MPETAARRRVRSSATSDSDRDSPSVPATRIRYYRRMNPQRVYAFEVGWKKGERPARGPVAVRLLAAGAQVVPSEQTLDASKADAVATFYVTPLARGWLRNVKVEVLHQGRKVQETPLASKVTTQRWTWIFLFLAILTPWLILSYVKYTPLRGPFVHENGFVENVEGNVAKNLETFVADNVPYLPAALDDTPVPGWLRDGRRYTCETYAGLVNMSQREPLAFYVGAGFLGLALISAWLHRAKRKTAWGKPIVVGDE